jgi:hypothetical protein
MPYVINHIIDLRILSIDSHQPLILAFISPGMQGTRPAADRQFIEILRFYPGQPGRGLRRLGKPARFPLLTLKASRIIHFIA